MEYDKAKINIPPQEGPSVGVLTGVICTSELRELSRRLEALAK